MDAVGSRLADDPEAFRDAYEQLSPMVGDYLRRFVPRGEVEDIRQQVFLEVWRSRSRYDAERGLEPWVLTIAKRRAIDYLRRQSRTPADPVATLPTRPAEPRGREARTDHLSGGVSETVAATATTCHRTCARDNSWVASSRPVPRPSPNCARR
jgi:RNA polymerase sigma factor (sigma-70 family)